MALLGRRAPSARRLIAAGDSQGGKNQTKIAILGIDLGNNSHDLVGLNS